MKQKQKYFTGGAPIKFGGGVPMGMPQQQQPGGNLMQSLVGLLGGGAPAGYAVGGGQGGGGIMELLGNLFGGGGGGMQGGGGGQGGGWQGLAQLLNGPQPQRQAMTNYQQIGLGGPIGGIDFPPADMGDPFGGRFGERLGDFAGGGFSPARMLSTFGGFGTGPSGGFSPFGPTTLPTYWNNYPGVGMVPMAVPTSGWALEGLSGAQQAVHYPPKSNA